MGEKAGANRSGLFKSRGPARRFGVSFTSTGAVQAPEACSRETSPRSRICVSGNSKFSFVYTDKKCIDHLVGWVPPMPPREGDAITVTLDHALMGTGTKFHPPPKDSYGPSRAVRFRIRVPPYDTDEQDPSDLRRRQFRLPHASN